MPLMCPINKSRYGFLHCIPFKIQASMPVSSAIFSWYFLIAHEAHMLSLVPRKRILIYTFIELLVSCVRSRLFSRCEQFGFKQRDMKMDAAHTQTRTQPCNAICLCTNRDINRQSQMSFVFYLPPIFFVNFSPLASCR